MHVPIREEHQEGLLLLTPGPVPSTDPSQEEGRQCSSPGSCAAHSYISASSPKSPLALGAVSLCSTGINGQFTMHERVPVLAGCSRSTTTFDPAANGANLNVLRLGSLPSFMVKRYSNVFPAAQFLSWKQRSHFCNAAVRPV